MRKDRDLKAWKRAEEELLDDPSSLSDAAWRRRELAHATDMDPNGHSDADVRIEIGPSPTLDTIEGGVNWCYGTRG